MEDFTVRLNDDVAIIESLGTMFKMSVHKNRKVAPDRNTAIMEATVYREDGAFVKDCNYLFEALSKEDKPVDEVDVELFKHAIDFFFTSIIGTDYYVKSIPIASSLCREDLKAFQFDVR
ncbi:hypothetical protein A0256_13360 [Mucilaginibacter sp. PAMC 26640]|nr:hypothetical protein A0256_13360 [Mucilaginibacter sp. PAMC 26640]